MQPSAAANISGTKVPGMFTSWVLNVSFLKNEEVNFFFMDGNLG
jgi:hypothetical protein